MTAKPQTLLRRSKAGSAIRLKRRSIVGKFGNRRLSRGAFVLNQAGIEPPLVQTRSSKARRQFAATPLIRSRRETKWVRWFCWAILLSLVIRLTVFLRQRTGGEFADIDAYAAVQIGLVLTSVALLIAVPSLRPVLAPIRRGALMWISALYLAGVFSALWSPFPAYSAFRALEQLSQLTLVAAVIVLERDGWRAERSILIGSAICILLSWVAVVRLSGLSFSLPVWHTNTYSACGAMMAAYAAGELMSGRRYGRLRLWVLGAFGLFAVLIGTSAASNIALGVAVGIAAIGARSWKIVAGCTVLILSGAVMGITSDELLTVATAGKDPEAVRTLTGRMYLWELYMPRFLENPYLGEGYAISARISELYVTNSHSAPISVLTGLGTLGGVLFVGFLVTLGIQGRAALRQHRPFAVGSVAALSAGLINSLACSYIAEGYSVATLGFNLFLAFAHIYVLLNRR